MKIIGTTIIVALGVAVGGLFRLLSLAQDPSPGQVTHHSHTVQMVSKEDATEDDSNDSTVPKSEAEANLRRKVKMLEQGERFLSGTDSYTATLKKQEVVDGALLDEQEMVFKCRHNPFSVYLRWLSGDVGREVIYVDGKNDGRLIAHDGGWRARLPAMSLHPESRLAMFDARYPITDAGMLTLTRTMLGIHRDDLTTANYASCEVDENQSFEGRRCVQFTLTYKSKEKSPEYRKSITFIDYEWNVPVRSLHFKWPDAGQAVADKDLDDATLVESYSFSDVKIPYPLSDSDFERTNPEYHFR